MARRFGLGTCQTERFSRYRYRCVQRLSAGLALLTAWVHATFFCGVALPAAAVATTPLEGHLANLDTTIAIEAGVEAPRLTWLRQRGGPQWRNLSRETLPTQVFIRGRTEPLTWRLDRGATRFAADRTDAVYVDETQHLKLIWRWQARARHGPLEHTILIQNLSDQRVGLPLQPTFRFDWQIQPDAPLERFWVEKGADTPSAEGVHRDALLNGDSWFGRSSTYARPIAGQPREMIPVLLVQHPGDSGAGWYVGIESSARTRISLDRTGSSLHGEAGLDASTASEPIGLMPLGSFETPTIFLGASTGGADVTGNALKRWVRAALNNPRILRDPRYPLLVGNSWGSNMAVDESLVRRMIAGASQLGLEMFHLDAGWFRDVGDWHADAKKFPHGIASLADFAHRHEMKFGLWMAWAEAGTSTQTGALSVYDAPARNWLIADAPAGWKHDEPYKGITLDLSVPDAQVWAAHELERVIRTYHLDMLEHDGYLVAQGTAHADHPAAAPDPATLHVYSNSGFLWADGSNMTDVSHRATLAYYALHRGLRARHPRLLLEVCNDGGRMVDFGSAAHGDYFSLTDTYDPLSNRRAFYDASYVLPPAMLETYVALSPTPQIESFRYQLRSGMLGWFSLLLDSSEWSRTQRAAAQREFAFYKSELRPLIRDADLFHVAARPDGIHWDGVEYYSTIRRRGLLYAFRGAITDEPAHRYRLQGLDPLQRYRLTFHDRGGAAQYLTGRSLMADGIEVALSLPLSSELVIIEAVSPRRAM